MGLIQYHGRIKKRSKYLTKIKNKIVLIKKIYLKSLIIKASKNDLRIKMKKYNWLIDLIAQMIFSVSFTILSLGGVLTVLNAI